MMKCGDTRFLPNNDDIYKLKTKTTTKNIYFSIHFVSVSNII